MITFMSLVFKFEYVGLRRAFNSMTRNRKHFFLILACLLATLPSFSSRAQAQGNISISIVSLDPDRFPEVGVVFRAVDSAGQAVKSLNSNQIDAYENGQSVAGLQNLRGIDGPVRVVFVVDLGLQNSTMKASVRRQILMQYAQEHFRNGIDSAAIILLNNSDSGTVAVDLTSSRDELVRGINNASLEPDKELSTRGMMGVDRAIAMLEKDSGAEQAGSAIIYLTDSIYSARSGYGSTLADAQNMGARAGDKHIPVYVFHTDTTEGDPLNALATASGGKLIRLTNSNEDNLPKINGIYQEIGTLGLVYEGSFRSVLGESGTRQVTILPRGAPLPGPAASTASFSVLLAAPVVTISKPDDGAAFARKGSRQGSSTSYDLNSIDVVAEISNWPDGHPRRIVSAELLVEGAGKTIVQPDPTATRFNFIWDISDILKEGANTRTIQVRVRDELGLESDSPSVAVQIAVTPPPPPEVAPAPSAPAITQVVVENVCDAAPSSRECWIMRGTLYGPWILLVLLGIVFLLLLRRLNQAIAVARKSGGPLGVKMNAALKTMIGGRAPNREEVLAHLHVLTARSDLVGEIIELGTVRQTIGRDPSLTDIQLYGEADSSSLSGQHCTIQYDQLRNVFLLTDNNSTNGTTINDRRIYPDDPTILNDGDIIVLGTLVKQGARLQFKRVNEVASPATPFEQEFVKPYENFSAGKETVLDDNLWAGDSFGQGGTETIIDTDSDVIDIVPPSQPKSGPDSKDRSWLDDLE